MPTTLIITGVISIIQIALFIIFILMLIKQFKHYLLVEPGNVETNIHW